MSDSHETETGRLRIDIVSDVVCPWCIIGYKQLEKALSDTDTDAEIHWHAFELNPHMPQEGQNLREHLAEKYGTTVEDSTLNRQRLAGIAADLGFEFNYTDDMRSYNTFRAHQLLHWAEELGLAHELKMALFAAYFTDGRHVGDVEVLAEIAGQVGLDAAEAAAILDEDRFAQEVRAMQQFWVSKGIRGVPAVIFDLKHLVSGAQGVDNFTMILNELKQNRAA